jgi:hypothetical protein
MSKYRNPDNVFGCARRKFLYRLKRIREWRPWMVRICADGSRDGQHSAETIADAVRPRGGKTDPKKIRPCIQTALSKEGRLLEY